MTPFGTHLYETLKKGDLEKNNFIYKQYLFAYLKYESLTPLPVIDGLGTQALWRRDSNIDLPIFR